MLIGELVDTREVAYIELRVVVMTLRFVCLDGRRHGRRHIVDQLR